MWTLPEPEPGTEPVTSVIVLVAQLCPTLTPWTVARQAPLHGTLQARQEYWRGLPFPSPGDLPDPGIEPVSVMSPEPPGKPINSGKEVN